MAVIGWPQEDLKGDLRTEGSLFELFVTKFQ